MPKGINVRRRSGPMGVERREYDTTELAMLLDRHQPTAEEMDLIFRAVRQWGRPRPHAPCNVLGMDCRAGLMSICALLAQDAPLPEDHELLLEQASEEALEP